MVDPVRSVYFMTFDEIMLRASKELGIPDDLHRLADSVAKSQSNVRQDLFNGVPDDQAVEIMKTIIVGMLKRMGKAPLN